METVGIIAAMAQEREAVLRLVEGRKRSILGPFRCDRFRLAGRDCWLVTSGMGPRRAAQAASTLMEAIHPGLLVSVGIAGAVNADLEIGDVVAARNTCVLDEGLAGPFQTLASLSEAAWQACAQALLAGGGAPGFRDGGHHARLSIYPVPARRDDKPCPGNGDSRHRPGCRATGDTAPIPARHQ